MTGMNGNPHAETATQRHELLMQTTDADPTLAMAHIAMLLAEATLTVAYEQRTANMLHALELKHRAHVAEFNRVFSDQIAARLGLTK